jgi:hypothetical protein
MYQSVLQVGHKPSYFSMSSNSMGVLHFGQTLFFVVILFFLLFNYFFLCWFCWVWEAFVEAVFIVDSDHQAVSAFAKGTKIYCACYSFLFFQF